MNGRTINWAALLGGLYALLSSGAVCTTSGGCSGEYLTGRIEPTTQATFDPTTGKVTFKDTKDNDFIVEDLTSTAVDGKLTSFNVKKLQLTNSSRTVIGADADRMDKILAAQQMQFDHLNRVSDNLVKIFDKLAVVAEAYIGKLPAPAAGVSLPAGIIVPTGP
jgi:hypothetical protein